MIVRSPRLKKRNNVPAQTQCLKIALFFNTLYKVYIYIPCCPTLYPILDVSHLYSSHSTQLFVFLDIYSPFYSAFSSLKRTTFSTYIHRFTPHSVHSRELLSRHLFTVLLRIQFTQEDYFLDIYSPFYSAFSPVRRTNIQN